jgi:hypothetical protein
MNGDLVPALTAAGGGSVLLGSIWAYERKRDEAMRASRTRLSLRFPARLDPLRAYAALNGLTGLAYTNELIAETTARPGSIEHFLWVPRQTRVSATATLAGVIPSLRVTEAPLASTDSALLALRLFVPTPSLLATDAAVETARALLSGLAALRGDEQVVIRFALRPGTPRRPREVAATDDFARQSDRAWQKKTIQGGFALAGLVLIRAAGVARARELAGHVENVVSSRRSLTGAVRVTRERGNRTLASLPRTTRTSGWLSSDELLPLLAWPLGDEAAPNVAVGSRELMTPAHIPTRGRVLFVGRDTNGSRPVALDAMAARHHMAVIGPPGVGKSVLLARAVLSDLKAGYGGVVIDPKADLIGDLVARVPAEHASRVVVLDPGDPRPIPGVAVLSGGDPDARADVLTGTLKAIFADAWGVRSDYYGRLAIRTLSEIPGATLADLGRLFYEQPFRRRAVARLRDPFLLSAWASYEALSPGAKAEHVQAPMARVLALLSRPRVRAVVASPDPRLDVARLLAERKWLLVSLAPGAIGEAGANLIGAALMYAVWSAIESRVRLAPEHRHPLFIYVDELATIANGVPFGIELLAERARGLGAGLTVALQTLGRIPEPTRSALTGNLATLVTFRTGAKEAPGLARELPPLTADDLAALGRFEVAARVASGTGAAVSIITGRTEALPPETSMGEAIRDASAERYGPRHDEAPVPPNVDLPDDDGMPLGAERRRP